MTSKWLLFVAGAAGLAHAQDWAQIRTGAAGTVFFRVAIPMASFRDLSLVEALDRIGPLRVPNIEASSGQRTAPNISKPFAPGLTAEEIATVKSALRNRKIVAYSIPSIPSEEPAARELFQFAKALGIETIISAAAPEALPLIGDWRRNSTSGWR